MGGIKRPSDTSTRTQDSHRVLSANAKGYYFYDTLALSLIYNTFAEASYMFTRTAWCNSFRHKRHMAAAQQAYAFIQGTGLEIMIEAYNMDYDAEVLRTIFYRKYNLEP